MSINLVLGKLEGVRRTGVDRGVAKCPAHEDGRASLSWRELPDGRALLHCFAGCEVQDVLAAVRLTMGDLFPEKPAADRVPREPRPFNAHDVLTAIAAEARIVAAAAANIRQGIEISEADHERLFVAAERIEEVRRLANGER